MENVTPVQQSSVNPVPVQQPEMQNNKPLLRSFSNSSSKKNGSFKPLLAIGLAVVLAGILTGYAIARVDTSTGNSETNTNEVAVNEGNLEANEAGIGDESMFEEDSPEGMLVEGGLDGEGTHHLDRNAGPEKMVYLTSSVINLDNFVGKKVKVWGHTVAAQNAPWLMDVGKIKVIE